MCWIYFLLLKKGYEKKMYFAVGIENIKLGKYTKNKLFSIVLDTPLILEKAHIIQVICIFFNK